MVTAVRPMRSVIHAIRRRSRMARSGYRVAMLAACALFGGCTGWAQADPEATPSSEQDDAGVHGAKVAIQPVFRMPLEAGAVVFCSQGNRPPPGQTHANPQNLYALDLSARGATSITVVSAAAGRVGFTHVDDGDDPEAGAGYGNQIKLEHSTELYTFYAHLDEVFVRPGDRVPAGFPLGTMGRSGLARERHLHFGLHRGHAFDAAITDSVPIRSLITAEMDGGRGFERIRSEELSCSTYTRPWSGSMYGSENDGAREPLLAAPRGPLARDLEEASVGLAQSMDCREAAAQFATASCTAPVVAAGKLEPWLRECPEDPVLRFYWATEVEAPRGEWRKALATLSDVIARGSEPAFFEPWLIPWSHNHLGLIDLSRKRRPAALDHFRVARELSSAPEVAEFGELMLRRADEQSLGIPGVL